ncbi:PilW family protein [Inmirania thermothiophila]|uniref:Tfp pilus assembly protein PilW n=1 Tax=Inmirania thermothiophila TaxID=1750597 RepID=A0A3N1Y8X4_9GAMM|nr:PilW family protein [Inmirania thermothiophila]ROR34991.1 Tfp pilus assembly protein PilW [Inmirania thermothiophila]
MRGLSLVELMVAMALSLVLLLGVVQIFVANRQSIRIQDGVTVLQENGRYALDQLAYSLRMADFWGASVPGDVVVDTGLGAISGDCTEVPVTRREGVEAVEGASASPISSCLADADYYAGADLDGSGAVDADERPDVLVVRHAQATAVAPADLALAANADRIFLETVPGGRGCIAKGSRLDPGAATKASCKAPSGVTSYVYPYSATLYFVRPCAVKGGITCSASSDGGSPVPTLVRMTLQEDELVEQALVSGVENLQVRFRTEGDTAFVDPGAVSDWGDVEAVEVSLTVRAEARDPTMTGSGPADGYIRRTFRTVVLLRNRAQAR